MLIDRLFLQYQTVMNRNVTQSWTKGVGVPLSNGMMIDGGSDDRSGSAMDLKFAADPPRNITEMNRNEQLVARNMTSSIPDQIFSGNSDGNWRGPIFYPDVSMRTPAFHQSYAPSIVITTVIDGKGEKTKTPKSRDDEQTITEYRRPEEPVPPYYSTERNSKSDHYSDRDRYSESNNYRYRKRERDDYVEQKRSPEQNQYSVRDQYSESNKYRYRNRERDEDVERKRCPG